jgi:uncharacterized protein (DUF427 family)
MSTNLDTRPTAEPGPDHPISISPEDVRVRLVAGEEIAGEARAVELQEARYPRLYYVRREDVPAHFLERSDLTTWCPYKGEANYFHLTGPDGVRRENAVWTYEAPRPAVAAIKDRLAFYPD